MRSFIRLSVAAILAGLFLFSVPLFPGHSQDADADSHYYSKEKKHSHSAVFTSREEKHDRGNEATGQAAAWIFAAANLPVVLSLLIKGITHSISMSDETRDRLKKFNRTQKKYLMPFHYVLNPLALILAFTHFTLSYCRSTSLPEWGLMIMAILAVTGLLIKFRLVPSSMIRTFHKIHTHPLFISLLVGLLLAGHSIVD